MATGGSGPKRSRIRGRRGKLHSFQIKKEVHTMTKVRFEIKLSTYRDGRTLARIYDDYWGSMDVTAFPPHTPGRLT